MLSVTPVCERGRACAPPPVAACGHRAGGACTAGSLGTLPLRVPIRPPILSEAMPIYEYRCEQGHVFEVMQRMSDDPVSSCQTCARPVERVFHPVAVHFKGSGFYNTDYGTRKRAREKAAESSSDTSSKSDAKSESKSDAKSDSKPAPKPDSKSSSSAASSD